ncbi:MAG TPA: hypothetical protein VJ140_07825 [Actinomycetota bacterium]|nr:hypothetical protein [Actinomycetota bacterium]
MRRDVLEVMADELVERAADPVASFLSWDGDGRRRLDGMSRGRRWDLDREQRQWERENRAELRRLYKSGWLRRWRASNREKRREYDRSYKERFKKRATAAMLAKRRAKKRARQKRWELKNRERHLASKAASARKRYAANPEPGKLQATRYYRENRDRVNARRRERYRKRRLAK